MRTRGAFPLLFTLIAASTLAGCVADQPQPNLPDIAGDRVSVYEYRFEGDALATIEVMYGWMARITNHGTGPVHYSVLPYGPFPIDMALATDTGADFVEINGTRPTNGTLPDDANATLVLEGGDSALWLFQTRLQQGSHTLGFAVHTVYEAETGTPGTVRNLTHFDRTVASGRGVLPISAGEQVHTMTVGVWTNGTSFYTNIASFATDAAFPAGFNETIDGTALPIYVYNQDSSEQPNGSIDRCYFTTIQGYNALLRTQAERTLGVRYLAPEEAYTVEGAENHTLYGDALVFLNVVVLREPRDMTAVLPDPTGACFDEERYLAGLPV